MSHRGHLPAEGSAQAGSTYLLPTESSEEPKDFTESVLISVRIVRSCDDLDDSFFRHLTTDFTDQSRMMTAFIRADPCHLWLKSAFPPLVVVSDRGEIYAG